MRSKTESDSQSSKISANFDQHIPISPSDLVTDSRIVVFRGTLLSLVRRDGRDLTARQLAAFLAVYMDEKTYTVSGLAELLCISRPGVTRIMDRLIQYDLIAREEAREDRRRVLVCRTASGAIFFAEVVGICGAVDLHTVGEAAR
jgi:DNA-binding MarR family transcriptional regulator